MCVRVVEILEHSREILTIYTEGLVGGWVGGLRRATIYEDQRRCERVDLCELWLLE
jgi:hypothetical protein